MHASSLFFHAGTTYIKFFSTLDVSLQVIVLCYHAVPRMAEVTYDRI